MDPTRNPFSPGAGLRPPEMAGRHTPVDLAQVTLSGLRRGQATRPVILYGLRGVGKTVLLNVIEEQARKAQCHVIMFEATDKIGMGEALVPELQRVLSRLSGSAKAKQLAVAGLNAVRDFMAQLEMSYADVKLGVKPRQPGDGSAGSQEVHLKQALIAVGEAAQAAGEPVVLLIDEIQSLHLRDDGRELGALIAALHRVGQLALPIGFFGAGLPQIHGIVSKLRSYSERFFQFIRVGALDEHDAIQAIREPVKDAGELIDVDALALIYHQTMGYPYFLQEYGHHAWLQAAQSPITRADVERAHVAAVAALDHGFFEARIQRVTNREKDYMFAMASLGRGPYDTGAVAEAAGESNNVLSPFRDGLIKKGVIWSPKRGQVDFTVPMFDSYLSRISPAPRASVAPSSRSKPARRSRKR